MLTKLILLFLTVGQILASSSYVEDGKRAELFEIMDTEVPSLKVTIEDKLFEELKVALQTPKLDFNNMFDAENAGNENVYGVTEFEKVKNATMVVEINGTEEEFSKVTFSIGGSSARTYGRQGFNIIINDEDKNLYGRSHFRLRSDPRDATYLRSKLSCDMLNRLGIVSISANYAKLYVNEEYFGFYVLMDAPKIPWVEQVFGEKNTTDLYKCKDGGQYLTEVQSISECVNENDDADNSEWKALVKAIDNAKTAEELDEFFDVDQFLYLAAFDYLVGAWDHFFHGGHNYSLYKNKKTGKWTMIYYDFDSDIGQDIVSVEFFNPFPLEDKNYPYYTVRDWFNFQFHITDIAIWDNLPAFESKLAEVVKDVFNPAILYPHIDELKEFIKPYILHDKTPNEDGLHPGVLNLLNPTDYSMEQWEANSEFTTINEPSVGSDAYGIKFWILERYRAVCTHYSLECDPVYMDENYEYPIDKEVEGEINLDKWAGFDWLAMMEGMGAPTDVAFDIDEPTEEPNAEPTEEPINEPIDEPIEKPIAKPTSEPSCLAQMDGYPCCEEGNTVVYESSANGDWGYDFYANEWCGLTPYDGRKDDEVCWSESYGYPCCKGCIIYANDKYGKWGYDFEKDTWCGIQSYCS